MNHPHPHPHPPLSAPPRRSPQRTADARTLYLISLGAHARNALAI